MATTEWIEAANRKPRPPVGDGIDSGGQHLLTLHRLSTDEEKQEQELARAAVLRHLGQDAGDILDMLGLAPAPTPETPAPPPTGKRCSACKEFKAFEEFYPRASARDGRYSQCKPCNNTAAAAARARKRPRDLRNARGSDRNIHWRITTPGGRGMSCSRAAVDGRRDTYRQLIRDGHTPREAAEQMQIGMRTARRYHAELKARGLL